MRPRSIAIAIATALLLPASAAAHQGNPNFRSEITSISPADAGLEAEVLNFDDNIQLFNRGEQTVVVEGYGEEPYIRIGPDGTVEVNKRSPAYYLNSDRYGEVDVPPEADVDAPPEWEFVDGTGQYSWHDHRSHYMSREVPPQVTDESVATKIFDYEIPIEVDGRKGALAGTLTWVGSDDGGTPVAPFVGLGVLTLIGLPAAVLWRRRRDRANAASEPAPGAASEQGDEPAAAKDREAW